MPDEVSIAGRARARVHARRGSLGRPCQLRLSLQLPSMDRSHNRYIRDIPNQIPEGDRLG